MNNFGAYEKEIRKLGLNRVAMVNGKIEDCYSIKCDWCDFQGGLCVDKKLNWLYKEYKEPPKLTRKEKGFCEAFRDCWLTRDQNDFLWLYKQEPKKYFCFWGTSLPAVMNVPKNMGLEFDFIRWEDKEPWAAEDLLKLEVKGEE